MFHQCSTGAAPAGVRPCDFCVKPSATWAYPCQPFDREVADGIHVVIAGPWNACTPCHRLIEADRWAELRQRSLRLYRYVHGPLARAADTAIAADLAPLWLQFRANRPGPAERIGGAS
ncbi:hypothetical protein ACFU53_15320 [Streptomyces sp. NPDC057474]|uniref:hypothetical protein n=1 Tax=Streptomyces sp. NPDC057474 TaxID=3346144 RepID=UPI0036C664F5